MSLQSIKSEICQLLNISSINASEAKKLSEASNLQSSNWSKLDTWQLLLDNLKVTQESSVMPLEQATTDETTSNDGSINEQVKTVVEPSIADIGITLDLNLGSLDLGLNVPIVDLNHPEVEQSKKVKKEKTFNLQQKVKQLVNYSQLVDSYKAVMFYLRLGSNITIYVIELEATNIPLVNHKINEIKEKNLTALEQYEQLLKQQKASNNTSTQLLEAKKQELEQKEILAIKAINKHSQVDAELTTTLSTEISKINFKDIAVKRQRKVKESVGENVNLNEDLRRTFIGLRKLLEVIDINDEIVIRLLIQQNETSYINKVYNYVSNNLPLQFRQYFSTNIDTRSPLTLIGNFVLSRQGIDDFTKYQEAIEQIEAINKDKRSDFEKALVAINKEATEYATNHLIANYSVDISEISLKQWISICLDNLEIEANRELGKSRIDVYADTIQEIEVKKNPVAIITKLLYENIYNSNVIIEQCEFNSNNLQILDRYAMNRSVNEFKSKFTNYLTSDLRYSNHELYCGNQPIDKKYQIAFNKLLENNRRFIKEWLKNNSTYKPKQLKDDYRKLYNMLSKVVTYQPSNLNIADEVLKISYRPTKSLEVLALPATLTSHFEGKEQLGDKYRRSQVAQGKMRTSAINDRSLNNLLPNVPLYCRQKIGDVIVMLKPSPVQDRLIDVAWCDKSSLDKGSKDLKFNPIGSLVIKKVNNKSCLFFNVPAKFITLASKHDLGNGLNALTPILAALHNWGLSSNNHVIYNPDRVKEIEENRKATEVYMNTDNVELEKHLSNKYPIAKKEKFIPIWQDNIQRYFHLEFKAIVIHPSTFLEVVDHREIKKINEFKTNNPQAKSIATNPITRVAYNIAKQNTLDKVDSSENVQSTTKEISEQEYNRLFKAEVKSNYRLGRLQNELEASEIVLKDKKILRKTPKFESFVIGCKYDGSPIIKKKQVGFTYYLITEKRIDTWHY